VTSEFRKSRDASVCIGAGYYISTILHENNHTTNDSHNRQRLIQ